MSSEKNHESHDAHQEPITPPDTSKLTFCEKDHLNLIKLNALSLPELVASAKEIAIENVPRRKDDIVCAILKKLKHLSIIGGGVLEILPENGFGFLRCPHNSFSSRKTDIYVPKGKINRHKLMTGHYVVCHVLPPREGNERYFSLGHVLSINGTPIDKIGYRYEFENLTPIFPNERLRMARPTKKDDTTPLVIDLVAPIGKGQRGLIVSSPKSGKTMMMESISHSITANHPEVHQIIFLVDERPEEVTQMQRTVKGEVISSTFDEAPSRHVQVAEMVLARAKRLVEMGKDVVILMDSLTRLARAYNAVAPSSGKVLSGGVESTALLKPKRFFGSARNLEGSGSLTIIATALVKTGSTMDEVIYEEFKGTGNMEIHLSRSTAQKRIYPAVDIRSSGTRRDDLLTTPDELKSMWVLRKYLLSMEDSQATEFLIERLKKVTSLDAFFKSMKGDGS